jgi:ATP-binding cassette subfamily C protein
LALGRVSFRLAPGECLGIVGPSGSGKSVLGRIIAGVTLPTHGRVFLGDVEVSTLAQTQNLGYLPQNIDLFGETVRDAIGRLEETELQKLIEAAKLAGVHDAIMRLPQAYNTALPKDDATPMRSYFQRLGLARAFFGNPRLVVLDEPNASLDYLGERMLFDAVQRMKAAGTITIIITHRIGILAATDKIAIMRGGILSAFGESKEIFEKYVSSPLVVAHDGVLQSTKQTTARGAEPCSNPV